MRREEDTCWFQNDKYVYKEWLGIAIYKECYSIILDLCHHLFSHMIDDFKTNSSCNTIIINVSMTFMILLFWYGSIQFIHSFFLFHFRYVLYQLLNLSVNYFPFFPTFCPDVCPRLTSRDIYTIHLYHPFCTCFCVFRMLKVFGLLVLLSLSNCFECNEEGYEDFLERYDFKAKKTDTYAYG